MSQSAAGRRLRAAARRLVEGGEAAARAARITAAWPPHTRLFVVGDRADWVLSREAAELERTARTLGIRVAASALAGVAVRQCVFYADQFVLTRRSFPTHNRVAVAYFHGRPGTPGAPEFDHMFGRLRALHRVIDRVQVSHGEMRETVLESGIAPEKVFTIPIAVDTTLFTPRDSHERDAIRRRYGVPSDAFVAGSFVKDGVGWGEGTEPKLVKGPDVLVETLARVRDSVPNLFVLLTGPSRGYVKRCLGDLGIPYVHVYAQRYEEVADLLAATDAVVIASRQEGGPKSLLEGMAAGVPVVTTRVGQAIDLARDGVNAFVVESEDAAALGDALRTIAAGSGSVADVVAAGRRTAADNSYHAQLPLWRAFFDGFVETRR